MASRGRSVVEQLTRDSKFEGLYPAAAGRHDIQHNDIHNNGSVAMLSVIYAVNITNNPFMLCVLMLNVSMLNVSMLNVSMLNVSTLNVIMLRVVAPPLAP